MARMASSERTFTTLSPCLNSIVVWPFDAAPTGKAKASRLPSMSRKHGKTLGVCTFRYEWSVVRRYTGIAVERRRTKRLVGFIGHNLEVYPTSIKFGQPVF